MIKKITFIFIALVSDSLIANACLNYYGLDEKGHVHSLENGPPDEVYLDSAIHLRNLAGLEARLDTATMKHFKDLSDYATTLVNIGRVEEAAVMLEALHAAHPLEYKIVANLAVVYELQGYPEAALDCLEESVKMNPLAHYESEWIHRQILEEKVRGRKGISTPDTAMILRPGALEPDLFERHLGYQLEERVPLTPSPDKLLSKVLEEGADRIRKGTSLESAASLYMMAIGYSTDSSRNLALYKKIRDCQQLYTRFRSRMDEDTRLPELSEDTWQERISDQVGFWKTYKPFYYKGIVKTKFN